jgi:hypothetical protein
MSEHSVARRFTVAALILVAGAAVAELVTGFFTGVGMDLRQVGVLVGNKIAPYQLEMKPPPSNPPADKRRCDQEKGAGLKEADTAVNKAEVVLERCMSDAKRSWIKRWAPQKYCENEVRLKRAMDAGREAWRAWKC